MQSKADVLLLHIFTYGSQPEHFEAQLSLEIILSDFCIQGCKFFILYTRFFNKKHDNVLSFIHTVSYF